MVFLDTIFVPGLHELPAYGADAGGFAKGAVLSVPRPEGTADPNTTPAAATWEQSGSVSYTHLTLPTKA